MNNCRLTPAVHGGTGYIDYIRWPKKVSHYHESSLNRIKTGH